VSAKIPANVREKQINELPNISFVRWADVYKDAHSKAICRCEIDGFEWAVSVTNLISHSHGCPQCAGVRRLTAKERIEQINAKPNISFVRWGGEYRGVRTKAICLCEIDGFEWSATVNHLINTNTVCPQCAGVVELTEAERVAQINAKPNTSFVRWAGVYRKGKSRAICRCAIDGFEWEASVSNLTSRNSGCPACAQGGFNPAKRGTLYLLRSECGSMVKIGISNNYEQRHAQLKRATPFNWSCIELLHNNDGAFIAKAEKELHSLTEQAQFSEPFDGYTEWRKWDDRIPMWIEEYRARA